MTADASEIRDSPGDTSDAGDVPPPSTFGHLAAALCPEGRLAAQCGGARNLATVVRVLEELGADPFTEKVFATPERTSERLRAAGFVDIECCMESPFETLEGLETFLRTVALGDHVRSMTDDEAGAFVHAVAERLPWLELDYVRLNIRARRASRRKPN